jgi:acylphosphatase
MNIHLNIKVFGRVQMVGFRSFARQTAIEYGIKGFVKNHQDGSVYIEIEATQMKTDLFLECCYQGSPLSKVTKINIEAAELKGYKIFEIQ